MMLKKTQALQGFMESFGMDAYPHTVKIREDAELPYIRYEKGMSHDGYSSTIHVYMRTTSDLVADQKAEEICNRLRRGGVQLICEDGTLWITLENPEWIGAPEEDFVKHRIINVLITDNTQ